MTSRAKAGGVGVAISGQSLMGCFDDRREKVGKFIKKCQNIYVTEGRLR